MEKYLSQYHTHGCFRLQRESSLKDKCNAPTDKIGLYFVYIKDKLKSELIYIGISGRISKNGEIICRKVGLGGIKDRIVNGYQFGKVKRKISWPSQMKKEGIKEIEVKWYVTTDDSYFHNPRDIEHKLLNLYFDENHQLPRWNKIK